MTTRCETEKLYSRIAELMLVLDDKNELPPSESIELQALLTAFWDTDCPDDNECRPNTCRFAQQGEGWIGIKGYRSLRDVLDHYEHQPTITPIKELWSTDALKAPWARRPGHYGG